MLRSVKRGVKTENDYLNSEVVALGKKTGRPTPFNSVVVDIVHQVETTGSFFTAHDVLAAVNRVSRST
jgi:2-dehydropantoate 2-reductase